MEILNAIIEKFKTFAAKKELTALRQNICKSKCMMETILFITSQTHKYLLCTTVKEENTSQLMLIPSRNGILCTEKRQLCSTISEDQWLLSINEKKTKTFNDKFKNKLSAISAQFLFKE